eukprot:m51a1_g3180 putative ubiquitin-conjugating enzyme e2 t-like (265) ;mRNA; f:412782-414363
MAGRRSAMWLNRMKREMEILKQHGASAWVEGEDPGAMAATVEGPPGSPYERGVFELAVVAPDRYPIDPPKVTFRTPVYHPNIDSSGRICLDVLSLPPKGSWKPSITLNVVFKAIQQLLATPNVDDPLMPEIAHEMSQTPALYASKAAKHTAEHACPETGCKRAAAEAEQSHDTQEPAEQTEPDRKRMRSWKPSITLNVDDPLMPEIAHEMSQTPALYASKAAKHTAAHACPETGCKRAAAEAEQSHDTHEPAELTEPDRKRMRS